jgi:hypothetical protein
VVKVLIERTTASPVLIPTRRKNIQPHFYGRAMSPNGLNSPRTTVSFPVPLRYIAGQHDGDISQ